MKKEFIYVQPKSIQAKNRFVTMMDKFHSCVVQQRTDDKILLASISGRYLFWISESEDAHWKIIK